VRTVWAEGAGRWEAERGETRGRSEWKRWAGAVEWGVRNRRGGLARGNGRAVGEGEAGGEDRRRGGAWRGRQGGAGKGLRKLGGAKAEASLGRDDLR
jgi:hypothetical protein